MISFTANFIKPTSVQKINTKNGEIKPFEVSCVELDPKDDKDLRAVKEVVYDWETLDGYDARIYSYMRNCAGDGKYLEKKTYGKEYLDKMRFYAITAQKENFDNLNSGDILALSQIKLDNDVELKYLQVKPENFSSYLCGEKFKYIGTQMLNLISSLFQGKNITLVTLPKNNGFYLKNGFEMHEKGGRFIKRQDKNG